MASNKAVFFLSLNSNLYQGFIENNDILKSYSKFQFDFLVFDNYEVLNSMFFNISEIQKHQENINSKIELLSEKNKNAIILSSKAEKDLSNYLNCVYNEFYKNQGFKRHCKNQIFTNLQPKLRNVGILNHKSPLIDLLCPFLLIEIAYYLYVYDKGIYNFTMGMESEMEIINAIKSKKYDNFVPFLNYPVEHIKVAID